MRCWRFAWSAVAILACVIAPARGAETTVWVGTTTPRDGMSRGIYRLTLNTESGAVSKAELAAEFSQPGWLCPGPGGRRLYSSGSRDGEPCVAAFEIRPDKSLRLMGSVAVGDGGATHLSVHPTAPLLLSAKYGGGSVGVFELSADGAVAGRVQLIEHSGGARVVGRRQDAPHPHWTGFDPSGRFALVPDLGLDAVVIYRVDSERLRLVPHGSAALPAGAGPRHLKFHPNGRFVFVLNELALSVTTFAWDSERGTLSLVDTVQTLTDQEKSNERFNSAAEIRVRPDGRFVYTSNRGHDSISVFRVDLDSGRLNRIETEPVRGSWPRNFNIHPSGRWLLAAGRDSNTLAVFEINRDDGELTWIRSMAFVPTPICVTFQPETAP